MMKRKGLTLVEVLVSLAIFLVLFTSISTIYLGSKKTVSKQEEYLRFETICYDIDAYSDKYGRAWDVNYFKDYDLKNKTVYYDASYEITTDPSAKYKLTYSYQDTEKGKQQLILSIRNERDGYFVIENLNYGGSRYAEGK